ncbi:MAG: hypothetical protein ChlgKO_12310 [Chlamydiales bacterium]
MSNTVYGAPLETKGINLSREAIFSGWKEGESSRVVGSIGMEWDCRDVEPRIKTLQVWAAQHHFSSNNPYFFSAKKICTTDIAWEKQSKLALRVYLVAIAICIGISLYVFLKTRSHFEKNWQECLSIAKSNKYVMRNAYDFFGHGRPATAKEIWRLHPEFGSAGTYFLRNIFCAVFPFLGVVGAASVFPERPSSKRFDLVVEREKDERVCPSNFGIKEDFDPLTQEEISEKELHSPQMIYLPNYVTDARGFMRAILKAGKKDFADPVYRRDFTEEEHAQILSQINRIFHISEKELNLCFERGGDVELFRNSMGPRRFLYDSRAFDKDGNFSVEARHHLNYISSDDNVAAMIEQIDTVAGSMLSQDHARIVRLNLLEQSGYTNSLRADSMADGRVSMFERETGVSLDIE